MSPKTPLRDPTGYFEDRPNPFTPGAGVFALHVLVDVVLVYLLLRFMLAEIDGLSSAERSEVTSTVTQVLFLAVFIYLIAWLVVAAVMHFGVGGPESRGSFGDAMGVAGWAYAPEVIAAVPTYLWVRQQIGALDLDASDPRALEAEIESMTTGAADGVALLILLGVTAWSVFILAKGVAQTHDVPLDRAVLPAVIVGIGSFIFGVAA